MYVIRGGVDHLSGAVAGNPIAVDWLSRRLARSLSVRPGPNVPVADGDRLAA